MIQFILSADHFVRSLRWTEKKKNQCKKKWTGTRELAKDHSVSSPVELFHPRVCRAHLYQV